MSQHFAFGMPFKIKVYHKDLKAMGVVKSRRDQHDQIKAGKLRAPNKNGDSQQAAAWWWFFDILEDLEREKNSESDDGN